MKRVLPLLSVPLALSLALVLAGAASHAKHNHGNRKHTAVRSYRSSRLALGLAPSSVLLTPASLSEDEQAFARLVNLERARKGLRQLTVDPVLTAAARQHSREMSELAYFDHFSPVRGLRSPLERYGVALGSRKFSCVVGENLFYSTRRDVDLGHRSLMKSPLHRDNIVASDYRAIGVGVYLAPSGEYYVTQMFHS